MRSVPRVVLALVLLVAPLLAQGRAALAATATFTSNAALTLPLGAPIATVGIASSFPSTITVAGVPASARKVSVTLSGVTHTSPGDLDVLLVGPQGQQVLLLSDAGTQGVTNISLTFDDDAATTLAASGALTAGTYRPTNYGLSDVFPQPTPVLNYNAALSTFKNTDPNGAWRLFVIDDALGDVGSIAGWSLSITDDTPVAQGDSYTNALNTPLTVNVGSGLLSNDAGALLTAVVDTGPAHGTLVLLPNGSFVYTPALNYSGSDSFTYHALNAAGASNTATVNLVVGNGILASGSALTTNEDTSASATLVGSSNIGGSLAFNVVTAPAHGTVNITNAASGAYTYTPAPNYAGTDTFTFKLNNGVVDSNIAAVSIDVRPVNDPPAISAPATLITAFNTPLVFGAASGNALLVSDVDIGLGAATLEITATHGSFIRPGGVLADSHFTLVGTPAELAVGLEDLQFVPEANYAGAASVALRVSDNGYIGSGGALNGTATIGITVQPGVQSITFPNPGRHRVVEPAGELQRGQRPRQR